MEVILKQNIDNLGDKGDLVTVKNGYGRNYLIPKGMAQIATASAKKVYEENQKQQTIKQARIKEEAQQIADKLQKATLKIGAKVSEKGKIFGSVTSVQVVDYINKQGFDIQRKSVILKDPIKELGKYKATVKLHKEISIDIEFEVVAE